MQKKQRKHHQVRASAPSHPHFHTNRKHLRSSQLRLTPHFRHGPQHSMPLAQAGTLRNWIGPQAAPTHERTDTQNLPHSHRKDHSVQRAWGQLFSLASKNHNGPGPWPWAASKSRPWALGMSHGLGHGPLAWPWALGTGPGRGHGPLPWP